MEVVVVVVVAVVTKGYSMSVKAGQAATPFLFRVPRRLGHTHPAGLSGFQCFSDTHLDLNIITDYIYFLYI